MANFIYKKAKESLLNGEIDVDSKDFKILFVNNNYIPNENTHEFISDITANAIVLRSDPISNISNVLGVLDGSDLDVPNYPGNPFNAIIMYQSDSFDSQSRLIFYIDTASGLPYEGSNSSNPITIIWSNDSTKILSL